MNAPLTHVIVVAFDVAKELMLEMQRLSTNAKGLVTGSMVDSISRKSITNLKLMDNHLKRFHSI